MVAMKKETAETSERLVAVVLADSFAKVSTIFRFRVML